ncbi:MAG: hypothetical protein ACLSUW_05590 [Akkermansia sp.]
MKWEQAVELGNLTGLDELANYYETVAGMCRSLRNGSSFWPLP